MCKYRSYIDIIIHIDNSYIDIIYMLMSFKHWYHLYIVISHTLISFTHWYYHHIIIHILYFVIFVIRAVFLSFLSSFPKSYNSLITFENLFEYLHSKKRNRNLLHCIFDQTASICSAWCEFLWFVQSHRTNSKFQNILRLLDVIITRTL